MKIRKKPFFKVTQKELAEIKIITGKFSAELKGKSIVASKHLTMKNK
jgi:hypothetical protein